MFLSAVWILILKAPIHCKASDEMLNLSKSVTTKKQTNQHLVINVKQIHFWVNYSFNK